MKKLLVLLLAIILTSILAGIYGAIHNQVTFTVSEEYFTRFKYSQFGFEPEWFGGDRPTVAFIGFLSTWWVGFLAGLVLGVTGLIHKDWRIMSKTTSRATLAIMLTAIFFGCAGFVYGTFNFTEPDPDSIFHEGVVDQKSFFVAGSIHNFSYLGGLFGLLGAMIYQIMERVRPRRPGKRPGMISKIRSRIETVFRSRH